MSTQHRAGNHLSGRWKWSVHPGSLAVLAPGWEMLKHRVNNLLIPAFTTTLAALPSPRLWTKPPQPYRLLKYPGTQDSPELGRPEYK